MKFAKIFAVVTVVMLALSGCTTRGNNTNSTVSRAANAVSNATDKVEDALEGENLNSHNESAYENDHDYDDNISAVQDGETSVDNDGTVINRNDETSVAAAMSTDFAEIGALDATKQSEFPGGPVDEKNRPSGPLLYQEKYKDLDALFIVPESDKIYLTFDEGYENGYTGKLLDTLKEKNVKAVFFITYDYATTQPELVQRMIKEGHVLGNHSTKHKSFPDLPLEEAAKDILLLHDYMKEKYNYEMFLFRPPMGEFSDQTLALVKSLGYKSVFWSFAYLDYEVDNQPLTIEAVDKITSKAHPGAIYLLHAVSKTNSMVLGECIDVLQKQGYEFAVWQK